MHVTSGTHNSDPRRHPVALRRFDGASPDLIRAATAPPLILVVLEPPASSSLACDIFSHTMNFLIPSQKLNR